MRFIIAVAVLCLCSCSTPSVVIDPANSQQRLEGWGTSLAWWADIVGDWPKATVDAVCHDLTSEEELGFTIFRYNLHGGDNPLPHADTVANHFRWDSGPTTLYRVGPDAPYDWTANQGQRRILRALLLRQPAAILEAIAYSPPYWMTASQCSAGAPDGGPNLPRGNEGIYADFLTDIVRYYHDSLGITFRTLTGLNEPSEHFWKIGGGQEGCHVPADQQAVLIDSLYHYLRRKDMLKYTGISAADENKIHETLATLRSYDGNTIDKLKQVNTHSYFPKPLKDDARQALADLVDHHGLHLWQSESGPLSPPPDARRGIENHLYLAQRIVHDLNRLRADGWVDWQIASTSPEWGFYTLDTLRQQLVRGKNYHVRKQFSRFIRPESRILSSPDTSVVAALGPREKKLILVVVNDNRRDRTLHFDLGAFGRMGATAAVVRTSADEDFISLPEVPVTNGRLRYKARSMTVSSLVVSLGNE